MIAYSLLLIIFALFGVILTLSENEYLVISGDVIVCACFIVYLILFVIWQLNEMKIKKNQLKKNEDFIKWLKNKKENKDEIR